VEDDDGRIVAEGRIEHERGNITAALSGYAADTPVAVETIGNWYWIVDEIEAAGLRPLLVHARRAKMMMASVNKTDRLDVRGLNRLQRVGTLPTVWIPPGDLRDRRELTRTRMFLVALRTKLKNRLRATLAKYALASPDVGAIFGPRNRERLVALAAQLPPCTKQMFDRELAQADELTQCVAAIEKQMHDCFDETDEVALLRSVPGIGFLLAVVISQEIGDVGRFGGPDRLASYAGTTPRVHASGGKVRYGALRSDVNQYLKWAFVEAANSVAVNKCHAPGRHASRLYERIKLKRGYPKAIGAVARHLAEATYWILKKREEYREPMRSTPTVA
jgi:transposase